jgi:hypothetical protein
LFALAFADSTASSCANTCKPRRKSEDGASSGRRSGTGSLTRHAVSLVQLPPPQESDGAESDNSLPPAIRQTCVNSATLPHKTTKTVTFLDHKIQEERDRERQREIDRDREMRVSFFTPKFHNRVQ